jgi:hypothetical protein
MAASDLRDDPAAALLLLHDAVPLRGDVSELLRSLLLPLLLSAQFAQPSAQVCPFLHSLLSDRLQCAHIGLLGRVRRRTFDRKSGLDNVRPRHR